ncbi:MAG: iron-containing alcohol dehydrogenase [Acetivibrionales bacterium]|jgi:alcohol dehydrogenase YqhD (iron-dependent ADH family)
MFDNFIFHIPTRFYFGKGAHEKVGEILKEQGAKKVLFYYGGKSIFQSGLHDQIADILKGSGIDYVEMGGVQPNPTVSFCRKTIDFIKAEKVDFILAVGGGSVIDSAKAAALSVGSDADPWDLVMKKSPIKSALPVGVILTIAASGSEVSEHSVLNDEESGMKRGVGSELIKPRFSILNPELTYTLPPYQTAAGIFDIIMHTAERYLSLNGENELLDRMSEGLIKSVISAGKEVLKDPKNYEARATLMWGGMISHSGLMSSGRKFFMCAHRLSHELSSMNDKITHGASLAVIWPGYIKYIYRYNIPRLTQYAVRIWNCDMDFANPEKTILEGISKTEEFIKSIGLPTRLQELGFGEDKVKLLAENCFRTAGYTGLPSYIDIKQKEMEDIYRLCL